MDPRLAVCVAERFTGQRPNHSNAQNDQDSNLATETEQNEGNEFYIRDLRPQSFILRPYSGITNPLTKSGFISVRCCVVAVKVAGDRGAAHSPSSRFGAAAECEKAIL
jgi:hypothetical protein